MAPDQKATHVHQRLAAERALDLLAEGGVMQKIKAQTDRMTNIDRSAVIARGHQHRQW